MTLEINKEYTGTTKGFICLETVKSIEGNMIKLKGYRSAFELVSITEEVITLKRGKVITTLENQ